jgi:hypothetical protein
MSKNVLTQYPKECLLEAKQTPTCISNPLEKPTTKDKTKPVGFQKVGHENRQHGVTWLGHFVVPFGTGRC